MKQHPKFYKARESVQSGSYKQESLRKLRRHLAALENSRIDDDLPEQSRLTIQIWQNNFREEIQKRNHEKKPHYWEILVGAATVLAAILCTLEYIEKHHGNSPAPSTKQHPTTPSTQKPQTHTNQTVHSSSNTTNP